ncbi:retrotransposon protein, putative, ty3-gypsy subclass [Tanacetum coccineum]
MPPHRSNRVNNEVDPAFTAMVALAVADLLPTLTARITDEIHQNENNGNRRNSRRGNPGGSGNDGDAQPTDIHVWLERFQKEKPQKCQFNNPLVARLATYKLEGDAHSWWRAYKQAKGGDAYVATLSWNDFRDIFFLQYFPYSEKERILNTEFTDVAQVANAARNIEISYDKSKNEGNNKRDRDGHHMATMADMVTGTDMALTGGVVIDRALSDMEKAYHRATGCLPLNVENVGPIAKDCKKGSTSSEEKRFGTFSFKF